MTATITENVEAPVEVTDPAVVTSAVKDEPKVIPVPLDEFGELAKSKLTAQIEEYNKLAKVVKAVEGDPSGMLAEFRESYTEDETVNKVRTALDEIRNKEEQLTAKLDELLKPIVERSVTEKKATLGDAPERAAKALKTINVSRKYLAETYCEEALADLPALEGRGKGGAKASGGAASGNRRIRGFDFFIDGTKAEIRNQEGKASSSAAAVSLVMKKAPYSTKFETEDVRQAFWAAAGTDDPDKYPNELTFTLPYGEGKIANISAKRVSDGSED